MLVVIGRQWLTVTDDQGRRRLDNPADFVRIEVEAALTRGIPVIPVLIQGAGVPRETDLPKSLADLAYRNGFTLRADPYFRSDVSMLMERMTEVLNRPNLVPPGTPAKAQSEPKPPKPQSVDVISSDQYGMALLLVHEGDNVSHRLFGEGTVLKIWVERGAIHADVLFRNSGKKSLDLTFANLQKI